MDDKKIGKFITELRESKGLNQTQLAEKIHFSRTLVNKIERGQVSVTSQNLKTLADFFNVSTDELLTGEYEHKENKELIENAKLRLVDQNSNLKKMISLSLFTTFIIVFGFLTYFFFTFYSSVTVYTFNTEREDITIANALLIKTHDKIYLRFEPLIKNENISYVSLYYNLNNELKVICDFNINENIISINDFYETQEYFNFKQFNKIKDNLYLEINYKNNKKTDIKLNLEKDYVNKQLLLKKSDGIEIDKTKTTDNDKIIDEFISKYKDISNVIIIDSIEYSVFTDDNSIIISYVNNKYYQISYYFEKGYLVKSDDGTNIYDFNYIENKCISGKCDSKDDDYDLIIKVLDGILKNSQEV